MTERTLWLLVAVFVACALWLIAGALLTVAHESPRIVPATAPDATAYIYNAEEP